MFFRKFFAGFVLMVLLGLFADAAFVFAQYIEPDEFEPLPTDATVLPDPYTTYEDCKTYLKNNNLQSKLSDSQEEANKVLGCAIKTGRVRMFMIPYFIVYLIDVLVKLAATLCVLFIVIGGFQYAIGGISDEKEKAKKTILNAIYGLIVTSMAWIVINVIQVAITSGGA